MGQTITPTILPSVVNNEVNLSVADAYTSYQWSENSIDIPFATSYLYTPDHSGTFTVMVISGEDDPASASITIEITSTGSFPHTMICTDAAELGVVSIHNLPLCQAVDGFITASRSTMPAGKYSIEYAVGADIKLTKPGDWLYMGCNSKTLVYSSPVHLGVGSGTGAPIYDAGYVYGSHFPADALLLEVRLTDRQMENSARDDRQGISPCRTYNKQFPFDDNDRHSLMVMHYENCIDNSAGFYALYDKLFLVEGQFGEAAAFTLSPLVVDNIQYVSISEGTVMMWLKRLCTATGVRYYIIDMEPFGSVANPLFSLYIDEKNRLVFEIIGYTMVEGTSYVQKDTYAVKYTIKDTDLNDTGKFNHVAITWKNGPSPEDNFMRLYINGVKKSLLKYDTGAKFGVSGLTEEEQIMGDYRAHSAIDVDVPCSSTAPGAVCFVGYTMPPPESISTDIASAFSLALCGAAPGSNAAPSEIAAYNRCVAGIDEYRILYSNGFDQYGGVIPSFNNDANVGNYVILFNNPNDSSKDQVRKIIANTGYYLLTDKPWDDLPVVNGTAYFMIVGKAYYVSERLDKFIRTKLPQSGFSADIRGLKGYYNNFVVNLKQNPFTGEPAWDPNGTFDGWVDTLNQKPAYQYDAVPTELIDISATGQELRKLQITNTANLYDFPRIYIGSDRNGQELGNVAIDQLAFYNTVVDDATMATYMAPKFIDIGGSGVVLGYDFDATNLPVSKFTTLQDEKAKAFETNINVLNPFNLPIDRALLTDLLNMVKPASSTFYVNYS